MPLYEIVLDSGEDQEVRLTDQAPALGEVIELHGRRWEIVDTLEASERSSARFRARPAAEASA